MPEFKDHFSSIADTYAAARPGYPDRLFDVLAAQVSRDAAVWEPGCGSGQATRGLAAHFARVHATDPSPQQLAQHWACASVVRADAVESPEDASADRSLDPAAAAPARAPDQAGRYASADPRVTLAVEPGESTALADRSVQLVAVAQALHWFDRPRFFAECERVLAPGGVLAAWGYPDFLVPEGLDAPVAAFRALIEPHWPPERAQIDARYAGYAWPFPALDAPELQLVTHWTLPQFLNYLGSMSAVARCRAATGIDAVAAHADAFAAAWGEPAESRAIRWPLFLHLRRKPD
jgi:SAM-dependent methyltransferase